MDELRDRLADYYDGRGDTPPSDDDIDAWLDHLECEWFC